MPLSFSRVNISLDCIHFVLYVKGYFSVCTIAKMIFCKSKAIFKFFSTSRTGKKLSSSVNKWARPVDGFPTEIRIYSSFTKELEPFILNEKGIVKWYSCGPTVYDKAHIGHACCYMKFDIIRRILEDFFNLKVHYIMGVTDIDDKIILKANVLRENFKTLAKLYEFEFFSDLRKLNILPPHTIARVSDHILEIQNCVDELMKKEVAYSAPDGSVYFDTQKYGCYGKLYWTPEENLSEPNSPHKKHPLDFALWKGMKPNEPFWETPWGCGRPGWHIECSVMASKYFGSQIDIHSGGIDLLFPHHENEEAQCCAYHNISQWVNYWIHSGHLFLKGTTKMSKSLENTIDVDECLEKYTPNDFRFMCLLSRYRNSLEYESDIMNKAISLRKKFGTFLENTSDFIRSLHNQGNVDEVKLFKALQETEENVRSALANDFNTVRAMSLLTDIVSLTNNMIQAESSSPFESKGIVAVACVANFVKKTLSLLGVDYEPTQVSKSSLNLMEDVVSTSVAFRNQIRKVAIAALKEKENNNKRESLLPHKIADYPYQKVGMDYMEFNKDLYIVIVDYCSQYPEIAKISNTKASSLITQVLDATNTFKSLLQACDQFRDEFLTAGIVIRDHKDQSAWSFDKNKNT
ncbi:cysteine--tRNA ligase, mitochondrial isoform X1 [Bemisia tabaci]|uniref:cysteine--tRNA ligase, mitochondrial isoform X1 n=1 Tax=Bemisia tabaci TaxID=7038 RepID=UPI003B28BC58